MFAELLCFCQSVKTCTYCWSSTNNSNIFIFTRWFIAMIINLCGRVWWNFEWPFCCCCSSWTSLNLIVLIIDNKLKNLGHSNKNFTGEVEKYMWTRSYLMKHKKNISLENNIKKRIYIWVSYKLTKNVDNKYLVMSPSVSILKHQF